MEAKQKGIIEAALDEVNTNDGTTTNRCIKATRWKPQKKFAAADSKEKEELHHRFGSLILNSSLAYNL